MRPAFSSLSQAAAFVVLLAGFVAAPWLIGRSLLPSREQAYATEGWSWGPYPWIQREIFEETNDIDIAFVGSSHLMWGIDTPYVQHQLDEKIGRKSVVRSICWGGTGFDALYFIARDLLAHRRVHTLVFYDESVTPYANQEAPNWFRFQEDAGALADLSFHEKSTYYFGATLGMPRNLLQLLLPDLPENTNDPTPNYFITAYQADNPETRLGSVRGRIDFDPVLGANQFFAPFTPATGVTAADVQVYQPATETNFLFLNQPLANWQQCFAGKFGRLATAHGCQLVLLHMPIMAEKDDAKIVESQYWPGRLHAEVAMVGIPTGRLFKGLTPENLHALYGDRWHLNENGQKYFTTLVTPELLKLYESWKPR